MSFQQYVVGYHLPRILSLGNFVQQEDIFLDIQLVGISLKICSSTEVIVLEWLGSDVHPMLQKLYMLLVIQNRLQQVQ